MVVKHALEQSGVTFESTLEWAARKLKEENKVALNREQGFNVNDMRMATAGETEFWRGWKSRYGKQGILILPSESWTSKLVGTR